MPDLSVDLTTVHAFEIFQYKGTLDYTVTAIGAEAEVGLERLGGTNRIAGVLSLTRVGTAELDFKAGAWKLDSAFSMAFFSSADLDAPLLKGALPGEYFGLLGFADGLPQRPRPAQYQIWNLDVFDPNDWNKNNIPDLTDPVAASVSLAVNGASLDLTVVAQAGITLNLEHTTNVNSASWDVVQTLTLMSPTNNLSLPLSADATGFYRMR